MKIRSGQWHTHTSTGFALLRRAALTVVVLTTVIGMQPTAQSDAALKTAALPGGELSLAVRLQPAPPTVKTATVYNAGTVVPLASGNLLVADMGNLDRTGGRVLITTRSGQVVWQYQGTLNIPHSAYPLANGDVLIADTGNNRVIEVNRKSQIVWDSDDLGGGHGRLGQGRLSDGTILDYPNDAVPLANGQIMLSLRLQNRVVKITRTGRITWKASRYLHRQHNPHVLPNGDMLIADSDANRVIEVDSTGTHVVWQYSTGLSWPRDAELMQNGNILIADSNDNRLLEVTRSGRAVNQWTGIPHVYWARPLHNGDLLVGDGATYGVVQVTPQHKIVWVLNHAHPSVANAGAGAPAPLQNGGFEQAVAGSPTLPAAWGRNDALAYSLAPGARADMVRDCSIHHSGSCSGRISYQGDSNGLFFGQTVSVRPGHTYRFSGWIKTQNVRACYPCSYGTSSVHGHSAEFELALYTGTGSSSPAPALPTHTGSSGWVHDSVSFTVPSGVSTLGINLTLRGQGTVWFDDVSLTNIAG